MLRRRPYRSVVVSEELSPSSFGPGELLSVLLIVGTLIAIASGFVRLAIQGRRGTPRCRSTG